MKIEEIKNEITLLFDMKEVSKRSTQFIGVGVIITAALTPVHMYDGHNLSAIITFIFSVFLGGVWIMHKKGLTKYSTAISIVGINIFLTIFNYAEGLKMGDYLFFFPLLFALPFLVRNKKKYTKEVLIYFIFTAACFCISLSISPQLSPWQIITDEQYSTIFYISAICSVLMSALFAYLGIYFERKYAAVLLDQKNRTEEAMKARSQFLSQMGHELRTPLNGIIGASNLLTKNNTLPEQSEYLNILKYCSNHMLELINNILDYNKIEAGKLDIHLTEMNLKQLVQNSALPFYNRFDEKKIQLLVEIDKELDVNVMIDDIRVIQILNNLISNALKFTEKGHVKLKVLRKTKDDQMIDVLFTVEDTGIGIHENDFPKIFESFGQVYTSTTRQYEGTGLGLSISQRLLALMGSKLELESEPGKGSNFSFSVKLKQTTTPNAQHTIVKMQNTDLSGMRILIAEDNVINMLIAKKIMADWNVSLTTAENGLIALQSLETDANYNIILLDLEMPEMDGYTAVREINKLYPGIPVLAFTAALIDQDMYSDLKNTGFVDAVLKPCQPMELFSKIRQYAN
ncbi:MAG: response regulator [Chitinophagaceae bacterium]|nr:response regulator [Chitinophagaceae bacterium]